MSYTMSYTDLQGYSGLHSRLTGGPGGPRSPGAPFSPCRNKKKISLKLKWSSRSITLSPEYLTDFKSSENRPFTPFITALYMPCSENVQNSSAWDRNYKIRPQARSFKKNKCHGN